MKKNIFSFAYDRNLIADLDCLLKFVRQPLSLDEFFKKFPNDILQAKLCELNFELERRHIFIILKNSNKVSKFELTNKHLSPLGITITDHAHLIDPLIVRQKSSPTSNLKDVLTNLITVNNNKNKQITINAFNDNNIILNHPDNKNKQAEINLFFIFLNKLILQEINRSDEEFIPATALIDSIRIELASVIDWFIFDNKKNIFDQEIYYSKKYNEIDNLINKLYSIKDTSFLAEKLSRLIIKYQQQLINLGSSENLPSHKKGIEIIKKFQCEAIKDIEEFQKNNPSLEQLNILFTILNAISKYLIPNFILSKNTRIGFFQHCTPQNNALGELKKIIQPKF